MLFSTKGKAQVIYKSVWGNKNFPEINIEPNSEKSPSSYKFAGNPKDAADVIKKVFQISSRELFDEKYAKAVSGNGDEAKKILTLHSSSRLALLFFYNMNPEHVVSIPIGDDMVEFDYSTFEFKNPVIGYPSNMDVVLLSKERKKALFLESKFSEYYMSAGTKGTPISTQYAENKYSEKLYDKAWLRSIGIESSYDPQDKEQKKFELSMQDGQLNYLDGFKQMISHYIGIRRRIDEKKRIVSDSSSLENKSIADEILSVIDKPDSKVYLGEVLFDGFYLPEGCESEPDPKQVLTDYSHLYSKLAARMNEIIKTDGLSDKFVVLAEDYKYSDMMRYCNLDPMTEDFYHVGEK